MKKNINCYLALCSLLALSSLFAACQTQATAGSPSIALHATPSSSTVNSPNAASSIVTASNTSSSTVTSPSTDCPTAGKARAMNLSTTFERSDPTIVYQYTQVAANRTTLKSYDVKTGTKNAIYAAPAGETVSNPMLSADGKWVVFVSYSTNGGAAQGNEKI